MSIVPRIWIFCDAPYFGGAEAYVDMLLRGAEPRARIGLVAFRRAGLGAWIEALRNDGITVNVLDGESLPARARALLGWTRRSAPELVHVNLPGPYEGLMGLAPWLLKLGGARRVMVTEHLPSVGRVGKRYRAKRLALRSVDAAIALCQRHAELLSSLYGYPPAKVRVVPNGVEIEEPGEVAKTELHPGAATGAWIVQVGALDERKGGAELIEAFAGLAAREPESILVFVGEGPEREPWMELARAKNLSARVVFAGRRDDVPRWVAAADVVVLASRREGMPLSLLEAMALGRAIVATDVDGIPEMLDQGTAGRIVAAGDTEGLRTALEELLADGALREQLGKRARQRQRELYRRRHMLAATYAVHEGLLR